MYPTFYFNSRPSARGDDKDISSQTGAKGISIHAPPRGATQKISTGKMELEISIHAPPRGATTLVLVLCRYERAFQFTPLREGRQAATSMQQHLMLFQFTPLREGRRINPAFNWSWNISIHAPPRGATHLVSSLSAHRFDFNSRPSARGDG